MIYDNVKLIKKMALGLLALAIIAGIGWAIYYWISHGRIVVNSPDGVSVKDIAYCNCNPVCGSMTEISSDSVSVESGQYVVRVSLNDNTSYVANVSVGGWLSSTEIKPKSQTFSVSPVVVDSGDYVLPIGGGYFTYESGSMGQVVDSNQSWYQVVAAQPIDEHRIIVLQQVSYEDTLTGSAASIYDDRTGDFVEIGQTKESALQENIRYGNNAIYVLGRDNNNVVEISADGVKTISIPDNVTYAKFGDYPIMIMNNSLAAVFSGNDFVPLDDGEYERGTEPSKVTLYDINGFSAKKTIDIAGTRSDVTSLSLSPDNTKIAVIGERSIEVYGVDSGKLEFSTPSDGDEVSSLFWKDNTSFVYSLGVGGVYMADLNSGDAYSIISNDLLRITNLSGFFDGKVYLTAFPNKEDNFEKTDPDGYVIDLASAIDQSQAGDSEDITRSLPYSDTGYDIKYRFTSAQMALSIKASQGYRNEAIKTIYRLEFDPADYDIQFEDYTNPFEESE